MALLRGKLLAGAIFAGALFGTSQVTAPPEPISTSGGGGGYAESWHIGKFDRLQKQEKQEKQEKQRRNQAKDEQELTLILSVLASERLLI